MNNRCTWKDCTKKATKPQKDKEGNIWANLCNKHHIELNKDFIDKINIKKLLKDWVLASGGAEVMSKNIMG